MEAGKIKYNHSICGYNILSNGEIKWFSETYDPEKDYGSPISIDEAIKVLEEHLPNDQTRSP